MRKVNYPLVGQKRKKIQTVNQFLITYISLIIEIIMLTQVKPIRPARSQSSAAHVTGIFRLRSNYNSTQSRGTARLIFAVLCAERAFRREVM